MPWRYLKVVQEPSSNLKCYQEFQEFCWWRLLNHYATERERRAYRQLVPIGLGKGGAPTMSTDKDNILITACAKSVPTPMLEFPSTLTRFQHFRISFYYYVLFPRRLRSSLGRRPVARTTWKNSVRMNDVPITSMRGVPDILLWSLHPYTMLHN